ncbi:MAG: ABC transporter substrate-binding protein, partial [Bacillales bacterium]|nr:ABC transporter substrate-binding protein [Bacillales bacterium]
AYIEGGFYRATLNQARNGWQWSPDLALSSPTPVNPELKNGKSISKTWEVELRHDLGWSFAPGIDTAGFDLDLNAQDYYWTYREALTRGLYRATTGGGDFYSEIVGAEDYGILAAELREDGITPQEQVQLDAEWAKVGIKITGDYLLSFTFKNKQSTFDAYYKLGWPAMNQDLWNKYGPDASVPGNVNLYGKDLLHVASSGPNIITYFEANKLTRTVENPKYPHRDETVWTGEDVIIYANQEVAFTAFLDGKLDMAGVPNSRVSEFASNPRTIRTPDATTWRLNINGLKTVEAQKAQFPTGIGNDFVPEPILGYSNFRKALYYSLNREELRDDWAPTRGTINTLFSNAYYVEPESGIPYRNTPQGIAVAEKFGLSTWGYNFDLAESYAKSAIEEALAEGYYSDFSTSGINLIHLDLRFMQLNESEAIYKTATFVKQEFEKIDVTAVVAGKSYRVKVATNIIDTDFPGIYTTYQMNGAFDFAMGGISGSALDAASFLDVFASDNRGGFTLNWGFDTSVPEIPVDYTLDGEERHEIWSFDALCVALSGKVTVDEGYEVAPTLDEGVYETAEALILELEDFLSYAEDITWGDGPFEIIAGTSAVLGGFWVTFPEGTTAAQIKAALASAGFVYITYDDGDWCGEFTNGSGYILSNIVDEDSVVPVAAVLAAYGETAPSAPAIYFY